MFTLTGSRSSIAKRPNSSGPTMPPLSRRPVHHDGDPPASTLPTGLSGPRPASSGRIFGARAGSASRPNTQGSPRQFTGARTSPRYKGAVPTDSPVASAAFQRRVVSALHDVLRSQRGSSSAETLPPPAARAADPPEPTSARETRDHQVRSYWESHDEKLHWSKEQNRGRRLASDVTQDQQPSMSPFSVDDTLRPAKEAFSHNTSAESDTFDGLTQKYALPRPPSGRSAGMFTPRSASGTGSGLSGLSSQPPSRFSSRPGSASTTLTGSMRGLRGPRPPSAGPSSPIRPNSRNGILLASRALSECESEELARRRQLVSAAEEIHTRLFRACRASDASPSPIVERVILAPALDPYAAVPSAHARPSSGGLDRSSLSPSAAASRQEQLRLEGNASYEGRDLVSAYMLYTRAIQVDRGHQVPLPFTAFLYLNRAAASMGLLNFDSAVNDCLEAISTGQRGGSDAIHMSLSPHSLLPKAWGRMAKSYAMGGRFDAARNAYTHALALLPHQEATPNAKTNAGLRQSFEKELAALASLEKLTNALVSEDVQTGWDALLSSSIEPFANDPPVSLLRLQLAVEKDPARARQEIGRYYSHVVDRMGACNIPVEEGSRSASSRARVVRPATTSSVTEGAGVQGAALTRHLCDVLVLHAKASLLSGSHFLEVARQKLQQALSMKPLYPSATVVSKAVEAFDGRMTEANQWASVGDLRNALESLAAVLRIPFVANSRLRGTIYLQRAEIQERLHNTPGILSECGMGIAASSGASSVTLAKLHALRSKAHANSGDFSMAIIEMESAIRTLAASASVDEEQWIRAGFSSIPSAGLNKEMVAELCAEYRTQVEKLRQSAADDGDAFKAFQRKYSQFRAGSASGNREGPKQAESRPSTASASQLSCPYTTLGLPLQSTVQQVKQRYRQLVLKVHPDKVVSEAGPVREAAMRRFKEVTQAYKNIIGEPA